MQHGWQNNHSRTRHPRPYDPDWTSNGGNVIEAAIARHPVGKYHYTVVYLPPTIASALPFAESARLRIEADVSGIPVKGAWQPARGRWYLMLPKQPLRQAGLSVGSPVEVAFRLLPQDEVEVPPELEELLRTDRTMRQAWTRLSAGKQRGLAHMIDSAKRPDTRRARLEQVRRVVLGLEPEPWNRKRPPARGPSAR